MMSYQQTADSTVEAVHRMGIAKVVKPFDGLIKVQPAQSAVGIVCYRVIGRQIAHEEMFERFARAVIERGPGKLVARAAAGAPDGVVTSTVRTAAETRQQQGSAEHEVLHWR